MSAAITMRGITWNHPRGLDPLLAANKVYPDVAPGVSIEWTTRSLSGFGEDPLIELA
ncbi:MAG: multiple sugar transport system substrate-binding protein, partial [Chloroflexota bacterium]|nr:multiple sugar transport system substrate-binding protein [Chloroflexota bacterium]